MEKHLYLYKGGLNNQVKSEETLLNELRMERRETNKKKWTKRIIFFILFLLFITSVYGVFVFYKTKSALDNAQVDLNREGDKSELREEAVNIGSNPISILLMGVERYSTGDKDGRADTQIVMTLNPNTNEMAMVTIPRDTRVNIENAGEYSGIHKINSAYTYGSITGYGAEKLQVETIEKLLNIPIDKFVAIDFDGFRDIIDAIGGVNIDIKEGFWEKNIYNNDEKIYFTPGQDKLNGEEALAFVRMRLRDVNLTYSRDERQRQLIEALIKQFISAGTIFKVDKITSILGENIDTDLSAEEIYILQQQYSKINKSTIKTILIGGQDQYVNGSSYFIPEESGIEEVSQQLRESLELK